MTAYAGTTDLFAGYAIRSDLAERRRVYYCEDGLPEAWPVVNSFDVPEDDRIKVIGDTAVSGNIVAFIVETDTKADRYIKKLLLWYPQVEVIKRADGPVKGTVLVKVGLRAASRS